ncbi:hypothetical protein MLD38_008497 [Melastoma candidum]|uniref:Uncharacterized protein n=1 Tax=Melastoma candidum TaxID=119954 RepID=A0ACB9RUG1_9MYRT|nr:hypothetical protein MLD38_008497 [Melastoma candidum]
MDKTNRSLILQTWKRCKSIGLSRRPSPLSLPSSPLPSPATTPARSTGKKSDDKRRRPNTPRGCFSVYVGPDKQRFVVRAESANHPLFRMLLEEAESKYGYTSGGPLELPCDVDLFCRVLTEMECGNKDDEDLITCRRGLGCRYGHGGYRLLSPARQLVAINQF